VFNIFSASLAISLDNRDVAEITASILCQFSLKPIQAFKCSGVVIRKMIDDRFFYLLGRNSDLVKIGGKRESLSGLSYKLKKIDGVDDGIFFIPKEDTNKRVRLAALAVSSTLTRDQIIPLLSQTIDSVFLPRPLKVVASLPYNKLGKLPFNNLIKMIDGASLDI
jgi:acyl-coenzyme A synthetase/AMP-(fatty) acid ligase